MDNLSSLADASGNFTLEAKDENDKIVGNMDKLYNYFFDNVDYDTLSKLVEYLEIECIFDEFFVGIKYLIKKPLAK